ncbi:MAG: glycosyltransferase family 4 protein [Deltaproteobacteria bacterium]|nr:glycosyltransferase family 4 protein [Deltaproteobacteria bacterium]
MRIWIIQIGEPLPIDSGARLMRSGQLAGLLAARGHDITWWAASFDHFHKRHRANGPTTIAAGPGLTIELLPSPGYRSNVSLARLLDHFILGWRFRSAVRTRARPDLVLASLPTLELAEEAVLHGRRAGVPVVVDVRDLWPDIFIAAVPAMIRPLARVALWRAFARARSILAGASAVTAVSETYLDWALSRSGRPRRSSDRVFPLGYAPESSAEDPPAGVPGRLSLPDGSVIAAFVGTFGVHYDLGTVIASARILWNRGRRDVLFVLAGDGEMGPRWRSEGIGLPNVLFPGWLTAGDIRTLLRKAAIGLVAYRAGAPQSLPNKPFEYMSRGLALLNSLPGELATLIDAERIGLGYTPGDPEDLARNVVRLVENPELLREMRDRSRMLFAQRFDADRIYSAMADHLIALAREGCPAP